MMSTPGGVMTGEAGGDGESDGVLGGGMAGVVGGVLVGGALVLGGALGGGEVGVTLGGATLGGAGAGVSAGVGTKLGVAMISAGASTLTWW